MNIIPIKELYQYNYSVDVVNALKQYWKNTDTFSCLNNPKKVNILVYFDNVSGEYTLKCGAKFIAEKGSLVYAPIGSEYSIRLFNFETPSANTVGINFFLYDASGEKFILDDKIIVFKNFDAFNIINKIDNTSESLIPCPAIMKSGLYDILTILSKNQETLPKKFLPIKAGIEYLEKDPLQELSIKEIANKCNVSEIYFRRLFKEYSQKSPIEYRMSAKMEKAKKLLLFDDLNVNEISDLLGFTDASYFCKQFKERVGVSPIQYRNKTN